MAPIAGVNNDNPATVGDDDALLDDFALFATPMEIKITGLSTGTYDVYTYAWAPDFSSYVTEVDVLGSTQGLQTVGGAWPGTNALGVTYALHQVGVSGGNDLTIRFTGLATEVSFNGLQIVPVSPGLLLCFGDNEADIGSGIVGCPCNNGSNLGDNAGCVHSQGFGARLLGFGSESYLADDLGFQITEAVPNQPAMIVQGSTLQLITFKDGLLCTGNPTERVEVVFLDGTGSGSTVGSIVTGGNVPGPGAKRYYQAWYRDPGGVSPCGTGSNFTNGVLIDFI